MDSGAGMRQGADMRDASGMDFKALMFGKGAEGPSASESTAHSRYGGSSGPSSRQGSMVLSNEFDLAQFRRKNSKDVFASHSAGADNSARNPITNGRIDVEPGKDGGSFSSAAKPISNATERTKSTGPLGGSKNVDFMSLMTNSHPPESPMATATSAAPAQGSFVQSNTLGKSDHRHAAARSYHQSDRQMSDSALRAPPSKRAGMERGGAPGTQSFVDTFSRQASPQFGVQSMPSQPPVVQTIDSGRYEQTIATLQAELSDMFHQRSLAEDATARAQSDLVSLQRRLAELEAELTESNARSSAAQKALRDLRSKVDEMEHSASINSVERTARVDAELAQARARVVELEGTTAALQREVGSLEVLARESEKLAQVTAQVEALETLKRKNTSALENLQTELARAEEAASAATTRETKAIEDLTDAESRLGLLQKQLEDAVAEEKQVREESAQMLYELELKNDALSNEIDQLRRDAIEKEREWAQVEEIQARLKLVAAERDALLADQRNNEAFLADAEARERALTQLVTQLEGKVLEAGLVPSTREGTDVVHIQHSSADSAASAGRDLHGNNEALPATNPTSAAEDRQLSMNTSNSQLESDVRQDAFQAICDELDDARIQENSAPDAPNHTERSLGVEAPAYDSASRRALAQPEHAISRSQSASQAFSEGNHSQLQTPPADRAKSEERRGGRDGGGVLHLVTSNLVPLALVTAVGLFALASNGVGMSNKLPFHSRTDHDRSEKMESKSDLSKVGGSGEVADGAQSESSKASSSNSTGTH
mmetsp:Transcript_9409/g.25026  ORF Transcript_9409/g.25026 Transcript_9409/m.25026 type:complete len:776 (+) Transcript_9409:325-2652(+)